MSKKKWPRARRSQDDNFAIKSDSKGRYQIKGNGGKTQVLYVVSHVMESRETSEIQLAISMSTSHYQTVNSRMCEAIEKPLRKVLEDAVKLAMDRASSTAEDLKKFQTETGCIAEIK